MDQGLRDVLQFEDVAKLQGPEKLIIWGSLGHWLRGGRRGNLPLHKFDVGLASRADNPEDGNEADLLFLSGVVVNDELLNLIHLVHHLGAKGRGVLGALAPQSDEQLVETGH